ncbi:MAG TPA: SH3 domain-containing protein, partial [Edaphobacter sp.]|nr:SH3 domain-containing protein [Edaphobacter sp.]
MGVVGALALTAGIAVGQAPKDKSLKYDRSARATVLHVATVYVAADADSQKVSVVTPGHEVVIVERSGPWVKVFANTDVGDNADEDDTSKPEFGEDENVTPASGWIRDKGVVGATTAGGDAIVY